MGCCGNRKNRVMPTGSKSKQKQSKDRAADLASSTRLGSRRSQTFAVQSKNGKTLKFGSELEAKAEIARNGGILKF